jgi:hypothetical protein
MDSFHKSHGANLRQNAGGESTSSNFEFAGVDLFRRSHNVNLRQKAGEENTSSNFKFPGNEKASTIITLKDGASIIPIWDMALPKGSQN